MSGARSETDGLDEQLLGNASTELHNAAMMRVDGKPASKFVDHLAGSEEARSEDGANLPT